MSLRCRLFGHQEGAPFSAAEGTLNVRCVECGWESPGVVLPSTTPVVTAPLSEVEKARAKATVIGLAGWKQKHRIQEVA